MNIKHSIREKMSRILDIYMAPGKWNQYVDGLDREGKPTRKQLLSIIIAICESIEELQTFINGEESIKTYKPRTVIDVVRDLDIASTLGKKAYYLSSLDYDLYAKAKKDEGYSRMTDPKDNKEKTCLMYKDLPVFKI